MIQIKTKKNIASDDEEAHKDPESPNDKEKKPKKKVVAPIYRKNISPIRTTSTKINNDESQNTN